LKRGKEVKEKKNIRAEYDFGGRIQERKGGKNSDRNRFREQVRRISQLLGTRQIKENNGVLCTHAGPVLWREMEHFPRLRENHLTQAEKVGAGWAGGIWNLATLKEHVSRKLGEGVGGIKT